MILIVVNMCHYSSLAFHNDLYKCSYMLYIESRGTKIMTLQQSLRSNQSVQQNLFMNSHQHGEFGQQKQHWVKEVELWGLWSERATKLVWECRKVFEYVGRGIRS